MMENIIGSLTETTWLVGWLICGIIGLVSVGITNSDSFDEEALGASIGVVFISAIWPIVLVFGVFCGMVAIPIYIGKFIGKGLDIMDKKKKKKLDGMKNVDRILKKKEAD